MAIDASALLGAPQIAGVNVYPRGATWAKAWRQGGLVAGGVVGAGAGEYASGKAAKRGAAGGAETPAFKGQAVLALTDADVALVKVKAGFVSSKPSEVLVQVPRNTVTAASLDDGMVPKLSITFTDGSTWTMDVPRVLKKQGDTKRIVELLQGRAMDLTV
ncbi:MAG TPA: hypothetical protein VG321_10150 [Solirubrobacteraceae bacterium]|jgi:hypothetical protein|nr:hypothetical protein [Solirubrobacteraceae bacterium]